MELRHIVRVLFGQHLLQLLAFVADANCELEGLALAVESLNRQCDLASDLLSLHRSSS